MHTAVGEVDSIHTKYCACFSVDCHLSISSQIKKSALCVKKNEVKQRKLGM